MARLGTGGVGVSGCVKAFTLITVLATYSARRRRMRFTKGRIGIGTTVNERDAFAEDGPTKSRRGRDGFGSCSRVNVDVGSNTTQLCRVGGNV